MYDIFFVGSVGWNDFKILYPNAQQVSSGVSYDDLSKKSFTKVFWVVWDDLKILDFSLNSYRVTEWDNRYIHVFKNGKSYDGICLFPKNLDVTETEFQTRYFRNKKEVDIEASLPVMYDKFQIADFEDYQYAIKNTKTTMFWGIWPEIDIEDESIFELYFSHHDSYNRNENHVFKNLRNNQETFLNGLVLYSKNKPISEREVKNRYLVNKKEHDRIVSINRYPKYLINKYEEYLSAINSCYAEMFWIQWPEIEITDTSIFDLYFDPRNGVYDTDRTQNHVWPVKRNNELVHIDGLWLCSVKQTISKREFTNRYLINKKEHDECVGKLRYPICTIRKYDDYKKMLDQCRSEMFWAVWPEIEITDESVFDLYFDPRNGMYDEDRAENHAWQHQFRADEVTYGGLHLMCKNKSVSKKEIDFRFLINKKEHEEIVSQHRFYDIVFISYNEPNADENYEALQQRFPHAKRVHGVKGIHQAHIAAAKLCDTEMFWVVDGDAAVNNDFDFSHVVNRYEISTVHVWRSLNPVNGLIYGYGGIKLLPTTLTINMDTTKPDMTTSISERFKAVQEVSNTTAFNTDPFNTWKGAFRECAKLASKVIDRQKDDETNERLKIWTTVGQDRPYGKYAIRGAKAGMKFGLSEKPNLKLINDFDWLQQQFVKHYDG